MLEYDKSSKWLIEHHGDQLLRLAGIVDIVAWRACQAEVVLPRKLPDGLLEVEIAGAPDPSLFVVELMAYPDPRAVEQVLRDQVLVFADRQVLPEVLVVVLHPRDQVQIPDSATLGSRHGWSRFTASWRVIELWTLPADQLLAAENPGLVPWIPLTHFDGPPEPILRRCREILDRKAPSEEHDSLLTVTCVLASLRYNDLDILTLIGGKSAMIEFPAVRDLVAEKVAENSQRNLLAFLRGRFKHVPEGVVSAVQAVTNPSRLEELITVAGDCKSLDEFRAAVKAERDGTTGSEDESE